MLALVNGIRAEGPRCCRPALRESCGSWEPQVQRRTSKRRGPALSCGLLLWAYGVCACGSPAPLRPRPAGADVVHAVDVPTAKVTPPPALRPIGQGFVDITPEPEPFHVPGIYEMGNANVPSMEAVLLADLDGDGRDEVIFSPTWDEGPDTEPAVYAWHGTALQRVALKLPSRVSVRAAADMDGDGALDLVVDGPGILWGDGKGAYPSISWLTPNDFSGSQSIALADLNGDGWLDVLQARGPGIVPGHDVLSFLRSNGRVFVPTPDILDQPDVGFIDSLGVALLDEQPTLVLANAHHVPPLPRFYRPDATNIWRPFYPVVKGGPNALLKATPMGGIACDIDGNQRIDFAFALDPDTVFWANDWWDRSNVTGIRRLPVLPGHSWPPMGWAFGCFDIDGDGRMDLIEACGNDVGGFVDPTHDSGPQPIKAYTFSPTWKATDVSALVGLSRMGQWHSLTTGDIDGDGAPDFAVGGWGESARVFLNRTGVASARLRLRSIHGQPAVAARVEAGGARWDSTSVSPLSQSDTQVFITRNAASAKVHFADHSVKTVSIALGRSDVVQASAK